MGIILSILRLLLNSDHICASHTVCHFEIVSLKLGIYLCIGKMVVSFHVLLAILLKS